MGPERLKCSSVVEYLPSICKVLGSVPSTKKTKNKDKMALNITAKLLSNVPKDTVICFVIIIHVLDGPSSGMSDIMLFALSSMLINNIC
jgi:hypothetical protein